MNDSSYGATVRQALSTVQQYLSDSIAPLLAAESVALLLEQPAQLVAAEIAQWASTQYQQKATDAGYSDFLFHAVKKLFDMGGLRLVPEERLHEYLQGLKPHIMEHCPVEDRKALAEELAHLGHGEAGLTQAVAYVHRMRGPGEALRPSTGREGGPSDLEKMRRRLSILWKRLGKEPSEAVGPIRPSSAKQEGLVSQVVTTATTAATSDDDFQKLQARLKSLGIDSGTDQIFRLLSRSLPGWSIPTVPGTEAGKPSGLRNPTLDAMRQILMLSGDGSESVKRFHDLVQAAIEQFNTGSLARAATIFDLASELATDAHLDAAAVAAVRRTAHESLDSERMRLMAKEGEKHYLLKKVLSFFDAYKVEGLLDRLKREPKRDQRRLLLSLLEVYGGAARDAAFQRLNMLLTSADIAHDWYFARNLVCLLNRIPMPEDALPEEEIDVMNELLKLSLPAAMNREVMTDLGQIKHPRAEKLLIEMAGDLERTLLDPHAATKDSAQVVALLDRTIHALARYGTPKAYRAVVDHGLRRKDQLGDTLARLSYLNGQDLSADEESVARLVATLKSRTPLKVFGVVLQKNDQVVLHLIKALASTPAPSVQQVFESISERFPEKEFGRAAVKALEEFAAGGKRTEAITERLIGDLELFSLPDLLQQLAVSKLSGTLTIKAVGGGSLGTMSLVDGKLQACSSGRLEGEEAAYQILEKPTAGSFVFQGRRDRPPQEESGTAPLRDLRSILFEGLRRYDELERARAIVPDLSLIKPTGTAPGALAAGDDPEFFARVWKSIGTGTTPEQCEAECTADSYRVRCLLGRWVEEEVLTVD